MLFNITTSESTPTYPCDLDAYSFLYDHMYGIYQATIISIKYPSQKFSVVYYLVIEHV